MGRRAVIAQKYGSPESPSAESEDDQLLQQSRVMNLEMLCHGRETDGEPQFKMYYEFPFGIDVCHDASREESIAYTRPRVCNILQAHLYVNSLCSLASGSLTRYVSELPHEFVA